jgi:hypothetical protein
MFISHPPNQPQALRLVDVNLLSDGIAFDEFNVI